MRKLYIVTRCLKNQKHYYLCHFRGFYRGYKISRIKVLKEELKLEEGEEYLMLAVENKLIEKTLIVRVIKCKNVQDMKVTSH
jgi:hypothetical protein